MTADTTNNKKTKGRPRGRATKVKLKHNPKTAFEDLLKKYKEVTDWGIFGIDDFTMEVINRLWNNPEITFHVTDLNEDRLSYANRIYGQRSFSMYRWNIYSHQGFIETPCVEVMLCSKLVWEEISKLPNPYDVDLILLEEI
jgi:hypothetical protein